MAAQAPSQTKTTTTISKLPPIREDVGVLKLRISDLEKEVMNYKSRLEDLRKAKNNLIIKNTKEYINLGAPAPAQGTRDPKDKRGSIASIADNHDNYNSNNNSNDVYNAELESVVENLTSELSISRDLAHALRVENEDLKAHLNHYSAELATALQKNENYKRELQTWEAKYKEWMHMMENRVENINRTHQVLQRTISKPSDEKEDDGSPKPTK